MPIPDSKPEFDIHAKVRIGEKRTSQKGTEYPAATDYFLSDSPDFAELAGDKPKALRIRFVHNTIEDAFSTGLEWWTKSKQAKKSTLACYTKDGGSDPIALRKTQMLDADDVKRGDERGNERTPITCRARQCPHFGKDCKPMGRLVFVLDGDPLSRVWQIDTKAWNSIEKIEGALRLAQANGTLTGRLFELTVAFQQKGRDSFPVMTIQEVADTFGPEAAAEVKKTEKEIGREKVRAALEGGETNPKRLLMIYFDHARPGYRDDEAWLAKFKEKLDVVGSEAALKAVMGE